MQRLMTFSNGESAKMGGSGWYLERRRAVLPVSVKMAMAATSRSSAAWDMHSQMVSAMESRTLGAWPKAICELLVRIWYSVSVTILAIMATASTGYLPAAVSPESMTA